jgi:hypothetical protein
MPSAPNKDHPALKNMKISIKTWKFFTFFLWLWVIFGVLDPDPADQNKWGGDPGVSGFRIHNIA